ncbi:hypothetical protein [Caminicella sporogenes]|uniref:hypothetical protein n=1 Tax=Caminicella sporogenes TaxID=166485 RepID=UPI00253FBF37|nr:hypothetical protein [Caminicella sporogenes]WIF94146.1 hypothetical protein QNI18_07475 [Caminicella sporogenes]
MFYSILIALFFTMLIGFIIENLILNFDLKRVSYINDKIKSLISKLVGDKKYFDIFMMNDLRRRFNEEFLNAKIVDEFELYKVDDSRIRIKYMTGYVVEELEVLTNESNVEVKEINKKIVD